MTLIFMSFLPSILTVTCLQIVALVSPGPDFAIVVRNSLIYSRKKAMLTSLGIALGIMVHVSYILLGIGSIITQTIWLITGLKIIGACYLIYVGYKGVRAKPMTNIHQEKEQHLSITSFAAFCSGFLTNALNPKAMLFMLSLFTVVIDPLTPHVVLGLYACIIFVTTLMWFTVVAFFFSTPKMRDFFSRFKHWVERITGGVLILIGCKLVVAEVK